MGRKCNNFIRDNVNKIFADELVSFMIHINTNAKNLYSP